MTNRTEIPLPRGHRLDFEIFEMRLGCTMTSFTCQGRMVTGSKCLRLVGVAIGAGCCTRILERLLSFSNGGVPLMHSDICQTGGQDEETEPDYPSDE